MAKYNLSLKLQLCRVFCVGVAFTMLLTFLITTVGSAYYLNNKAQATDREIANMIKKEQSKSVWNKGSKVLS
jgi:hypothetical protein